MKSAYQNEFDWNHWLYGFFYIFTVMQELRSAKFNKTAMLEA